MIDVHVITLPTTNRQWLEHCLDSLADEPVTVHMVDGVVGNIGVGRSRGFSMGDHPYVSFVDPDDWVLEGCFEACIQALLENPDAGMAYTREVLADSEGNIHSERPKEWYEPYIGSKEETEKAHHLTVYNRSAIHPFLPRFSGYPYTPELFSKTYVWLRHGFVFVDRIGYVWRKHSSNSHKTMACPWASEERKIYMRWRNAMG